MDIVPAREEFRKIAKPGHMVAMMGSLLADRSTPVTVFESIEHEPYAFLLESVENGAAIGRYSFVGCRPDEVIAVRGNKTIIEGADETRTVDDGNDSTNGDPASGEGTADGSGLFAALRRRLKAHPPIVPEGFPPFTGGAVSMMTYDIVRHFEDLPNEPPDDLELPDAVFMIVRELVAFDHVRRRLHLIVNVVVDDATNDADAAAAADRAWAAGKKAIEAMRLRYTAAPRPAEAARLPIPDLLKAPAVRDSTANHAGEGAGGTGSPAVGADERTGKRRGAEEYPVDPETIDGGLPLPAWSNTPRDKFLADVERCREYIRAGDAFQIVLSQRFRTDTACRPFDIYRSLRDVNPSPYMYYLQFGGVRLAGSSPEILVRLTGNEMNVRPIAGTRPRGADEAEDRALEADLLADQKERAEHLMLVDLGRNDLGRVAVPGSVRADRLFTIERYSHVMHIVSNVAATMRPDLDAFDLLAATFPAGTLSGAPKIRAMEIIDELEPVRRGSYAGAVGYFGFNGNLDACITIRTALLREGKAYIQAGAGLVYDSVPETEYTETVNKARALLRAIASANAGLD